jgi:hypothetical protein
MSKILLVHVRHPRGMASGKAVAAQRQAWLVFEDEAGQTLRAPKARTWGRRGHTPVVPVSGKGSGRVSIAGLTCSTRWIPRSRRADPGTRLNLTIQPLSLTQCPLLKVICERTLHTGVLRLSLHSNRSWGVHTRPLQRLLRSSGHYSESLTDLGTSARGRVKAGDTQRDDATRRWRACSAADQCVLGSERE